ncbi:MAG: hypothetical protein ABEI99_12875, partial [Halobaculum sp.]
MSDSSADEATETAEVDGETETVETESDSASEEAAIVDLEAAAEYETMAEEMRETIEDCAAVNPDVRLDDVGFPRAEYC